MFAGHQPALPVAGLAVAEVGWLTERRDLPGLLVPAHDAVVGNVREQQTICIAKPDRPFGPVEPGRQLLNWRIKHDIGCKFRIDSFKKGHDALQGLFEVIDNIRADTRKGEGASG